MLIIKKKKREEIFSRHALTDQQATDRLGEESFNVEEE
jgi:hypothetical protein